MPLFGLREIFSKNTDAIALKLRTLIGHHQMSLQDKSQYSISDFIQLCTFLDLEILVKVLRATTLRVHISVLTRCIALKLYKTRPNHHSYVYY